LFREVDVGGEKRVAPERNQDRGGVDDGNDVGQRKVDRIFNG
ncbi:MAG: hypothetical protein QOE30_5943, partial [Mycobacterium sp.]|nr:hypothetical protein [Mycobacterium sp.]